VLWYLTSLYIVVVSFIGGENHRPLASQ